MDQLGSILGQLGTMRDQDCAFRLAGWNLARRTRSEHLIELILRHLQQLMHSPRRSICHRSSTKTNTDMPETPRSCQDHPPPTRIRTGTPPPTKACAQVRPPGKTTASD